jgi:hypothetical protein
MNPVLPILLLAASLLARGQTAIPSPIPSPADNRDDAHSHNLTIRLAAWGGTAIHPNAHNPQ